MKDNKKVAHDIAVALLPKSLELTQTELNLKNENGFVQTNSFEIVEAYYELYNEILDELNHRQ